MIKKFLQFIALFSALYLLIAQASALNDQAYFEKVSILESTVDTIAVDEGPFSESLFEPLMTLARLYISELDYEKATDVLHRAQNITHRNEGVYSPKQLEAIELLTQMALADSEFKRANQHQKFMFFVTQHHLDADDPEILFAYAEMAAWYMSTGQTRRARRLLKEAIEVADQLEQDPLPIAIQMNRARLLEGLCCNTKALVAALDRTHGNDPDTLAEAYLELGDTFTLARKPERAAEYFARAFEVSPMGTSVDPRMLTIRRVMEGSKRMHTQAYRVERDMFHRNKLTLMTPTEQLEDLSIEPQWFILDGNQSHRGFVSPDVNATSDRNKETQVMVGHPIMFSEDQLHNMNSFRFNTRTQDLKIILSFTVLASGDLNDIEIMESSAPTKLNRLVVAALRKSYYRPALLDGVPTRTQNVTLIQTFYAERSLHGSFE